MKEKWLCGEEETEQEEWKEKARGGKGEEKEKGEMGGEWKGKGRKVKVEQELEELEGDRKSSCFQYEKIICKIVCNGRISKK